LRILFTCSIQRSIDVLLLARIERCKGSVDCAVLQAISAQSSTNKLCGIADGSNYNAFRWYARLILRRSERIEYRYLEDFTIFFTRKIHANRYAH